ncbi:hypothetical protein CEXT_589301 [Caerostris extrusa]|uniref:Uncharacterized protein n=1 Tax=Caerostris extrusa TaxID=172846 RepID=A0AAV4SRE0_CAEEX|nr:hypothetical protein CEXT_589301 [Caerostris extrusa]
MEKTRGFKSRENLASTLRVGRPHVNVKGLSFLTLAINRASLFVVVGPGKQGFSFAKDSFETLEVLKTNADVKSRDDEGVLYWYSVDTESKETQLLEPVQKEEKVLKAHHDA